MFFKTVLTLFSYGVSINFFFVTTFLFPQAFLLINSISLSFEPWICVTFHLYNDFLFLVLFWMLRVLLGPHAARITSNKIFPTELFLVCPTKLVWYCSHASWIKVHKNIARKLLPVRSYLLYRKRKSRNQELQRKLQKSLMFFYSSLRHSIQIKIKFLLRDRTYENFILLFIILRADLNQSFS